MAALFVAPASGQMRVAELGEVYESYNDCFAVTETGSIDPAALAAAGWQRATMSNGDGGEIEDGPIIFGHLERAPIIMLSALEGEGACIVIARIKNLKAFEQFKSAWGGKLPQPNKDGEISFFAEGRAVQMAPTGSRKEPSLRLAVGTRMESN
ncbi:hypothetical protein [Blastomonas marina]|nr:hypothetical protein [Blastomonas marina]